jgi:predicted lipoprotein with Yx(FWY)xxD motif
MRAKTMLPLAVLVALAAAAAALASPRHAKVSLRSTSLGSVLVDARGHTLYLFEADHAGKSACYGQCAAVWPPFLTGTAPLAGVGVKHGALTMRKRKDGRLQVLYAGHPLYFFAADARAGQTKGEGITHFGGSWFAVGAAGRKVVSQASAGGTTTTPPPAYGGGGGYGYGDGG